MKRRRDIIINTLAEKYYEFICSLKYEDKLYMKGIHEGKGKFLANLHIFLATSDLPKKWNDKRYSTDFVTPSALEVLKGNSVTGLEYEHLVPKKNIYKMFVNREHPRVLLLWNSLKISLINIYGQQLSRQMSIIY